MCHYKQLAVAVEAQLQSSTRKNWSDESIMEDSSVTLLSGTEHASSNHHFCTSTIVDGNSTCEMEPTLILSGESASLSSAVIKKLMPSNELEKRILRTADVRSKSASMLESFQQYTVGHSPILVLNPIQQHVIQQNCSSEVENVGQCITIDARRKEGLCSENKDSSVRDSKSEGVLVNDDITDHDKCCLENVQQDSRLILTKNIFSPNYTGFRPWKKVHNGNTSNECDMVLKTCQGMVSTLSGNQQETKQVVTDSDVNINMVESADHSMDKNGSHHSFIMPVMQNVNHKSTSVVSDTDDNGQKCGAINDALESRTECVNDKECMSQDENHSKNPLEPVKLQPEVNCTFPLHSQKVANPNIPVQNLPHLSKETREGDNVSEPGKICEEILDISKGLQSEYCCSDDCVRLNSLGSDRNILMNKYVSSGHSSSGHTEFPDVTSDVLHPLTQENLEDSVSSVAMTSSTDLNHYMNITGSSDSGSPGQDFAAHSSKLSGQDIHNNTSSMAAWYSPSLSESSVGDQNLQSARCSESTLISCHSSLIGDKAQDTIQNVVDNTMGTTARQDNVCVVETFVVQSDSSDDLRVSYPVNVDCAICPTKNSRTTCENMNCHVAKPTECLSVPKLKLQCNKSVHGHDDLDTPTRLISRCVQESNSTEKNLDAESGWDITKPETPLPRLVRQNSYTLDVPSPLLVAHIEMQKEQNSIYDMTGSVNLSPKPCRKAWDLAKAKSKWKLGRKKGNSLFAVLNQKDKPNNKINCDDTISSRCAFLAGGQDHHISSLPASNASSPVKVLTPFASLDSLPLAISIESVKTFRQPSTPRQNKGSCIASISSTATIVTNRSRTSQKKSPASNTSRSAKHSTPSALLDGLPSGSPKNRLKTFLEPSAQIKNKDSSKCSILSTPTKQSSNRSRSCQNNSPAKTLMKNVPTVNLPVASQDNLKKISDFKYVPLSSQQDIRRLILHMQSEHHQQMADLLAKQRLEQEKLREAFLQQQEELVHEIHKVYSTAICASDSQKPLAQQTPSHDYSANHENGSLNSSINPFPSGLSSKSLSFENAGTSVTSMCDVTDKCILVDTNLERFLTVTSASTEKGQTVTGNGLCKDSMQDKASNDMTAHLHESSHETMSVEEVPQNPLQNCSSVIFSDSNSIERYLPVDSSHQSPEVLVPPQLGKLQKHNSNYGEETTKIRVDTCNANIPVSCRSSTYPRTTSSVAASGTVLLPVTVNHVLQRAEADFAASCVHNIPLVQESGSVELTVGQNNDIKGRSPCIRQLFPSHEEAGDLRPKHPPSRSELEQVRFLFLYVTVIQG